MEIVLKSGVDSEPQNLYKVFRSAMEEHVNLVRGEPWNENREHAQFMEQLDLQTVHLILENKKCVGYIDIRDQQHTQFIHMFVIEPKWQRKGIGSRVLNMFKAQMTASKSIELTVFKSNHAAQKFYIQHGFQIIEERKYHYLMRWSRQQNNLH